MWLASEFGLAGYTWNRQQDLVSGDGAELNTRKWWQRKRISMREF